MTKNKNGYYPSDGTYKPGEKEYDEVIDARADLREMQRYGKIESISVVTWTPWGYFKGTKEEIEEICKEARLLMGDGKDD